MPQVNLSSLNGQELRQLLDASRRRGDASLSYKVLQEMAARREGPETRKGFGGRSPEPRHIEADLGEPMEEEVDDVPPTPPGWRPQVVAAGAEATGAEATGAEATGAEAGDIEVEDPPAMGRERMNPPEAEPLDDDRPLTLHDNDPDRSEEATMPQFGSRSGRRFEPVEIEPARERRPPRGRLVTGLAVGAVLGVAFGWLAGWLARDAIATRPAVVQTAALSPPPVPAEGQGAPTPAPSINDPAATSPQALGPASATAPEAATTAAPPIPQAATPAGSPGSLAAPVPPVVAKASPVVIAAKAPSPAPAAKPPLDGAALELPAADAEDAANAKPPKVIKIPTTAVAKGCETQPTAADKAICGDVKLKHLQGELRQAYEAALAAHEDRALLREHQLAWRDARSTVTDPGKLAQLYEARIRKLNAATAEALKAKP